MNSLIQKLKLLFKREHDSGRLCVPTLQGGQAQGGAGAYASPPM
jgi:hypothetical protein